MKKAEKKLIKQMQKRLGSAPAHYLLWTGEPGDGFRFDASVDPDADVLLTVSMSIFSMLDDRQRRQLHLMMAHSMENSPEEVWAETREGYV